METHEIINTLKHYALQTGEPNDNAVFSALKLLPFEQKQVIHYRYVVGIQTRGRLMTWAAVAKKLNYTDRHCKRLHTKALVSLSEQLCEPALNQGICEKCTKIS
jgi:DNA-directed RNA polymerase specialized sigma subunit